MQINIRKYYFQEIQVKKKLHKELCHYFKNANSFKNDSDQKASEGLMGCAEDISY